MVEISVTNSQSDFDSKANHKLELDCLIKNYVKEASKLDKNRLPKLSLSNITVVIENETKFLKKLKLIIANIPKEKSIDILSSYILGLKKLEEKFSFRGNFLIGSVIFITFIATSLNLFTKNLVEGLVVYPYLQVGLSILYLYMAGSTIQSGWEFKRLSSNIKGIVLIFESVSDEIKGSIV